MTIGVAFQETFLNHAAQALVLHKVQRAYGDSTILVAGSYKPYEGKNTQLTSICSVEEVKSSNDDNEVYADKSSDKLSEDEEKIFSSFLG